MEVQNAAVDNPSVSTYDSLLTSDCVTLEGHNGVLFCLAYNNSSGGAGGPAFQDYPYTDSACSTSSNGTDDTTDVVEFTSAVYDGNRTVLVADYTLEDPPPECPQERPFDVVVASDEPTPPAPSSSPPPGSVSSNNGDSSSSAAYVTSLGPLGRAGLAAAVAIAFLVI